MKKRIFVPMAAFAASVALTACSGGADASQEAGQEQEANQKAGQEANQETGQKQEGESPDGQENVEEGKNSEAAAGTEKANWTIEEAIENHMRFSGKGFYSMYAEGTTLYAAPNAVSDTESFSRYAELVSEGTAGSQLRQIQTADYSDMELILDFEGRLWYCGEQIFDDYNIQYFDCFFVTNAGYTQNVAAVTADGTVVYCDAQSLDSEVNTAEGLTNVKYVDAFWDDLAVVRQDGTAAYMDGGEVTELEGWTDMAMVYLNGDQNDYSELIGLKQDGTLVAQAMVGTPEYPEEILSWTDIVQVIRGNEYVAGLKSDGSFVYALEADAGDYTKELCEETYGTWTNVMAAAKEAAITADRELLGDARFLSYGWNLENPYTDPEAARLEGEYDDDMHTVLLTRLPEVS